MDSKRENGHAGKSRRTLLRGAAALAASSTGRAASRKAREGALQIAGSSRGQRAVFAYVGCYTTAERRARGDGIHVYRMDPQTGTWSHIQRLGNLVNPSLLIPSRDGRFLYSVHGDETYASSFAIDRNTGNLAPLNQAPTGGRNGVYQAIDSSGRFMVVANYASGTVAVLPIAPDGRLQPFVELEELHGAPGPNRAEQAGSHPHQVVFDPSGRFVLVPDKGLDRVFVFHFDPATGKLRPTDQGSVHTRSGSGPRHLAFHPSLAVVWVLNEINSTVTTYNWDAERGALRALQVMPTLAPDFTGDSTAAEIAVSAGGRFVYCSNRGHDSVAIYAADPKTGLLTSNGWVPTQGHSPRFICFDPSGRFLHVANEQSDTIVCFRADAQSGHLAATGNPVSNASPVTIAFAPGV
jgi:6-phosphogluconolactonase